MGKRFNLYAIFWFVFGIIFFIFATIDMAKGNAERSLGEIGISLACHARCEVKILEKKIGG